MYDYNNLPFPVTRVFTDSYGNKHVFLDTRYYAIGKGGGFLGKVSSFFKGTKTTSKTALGSNNRKGSLFSIDKKFTPLNNKPTPRQKIKINTPENIKKNFKKGPVSATKALDDATKLINDKIASQKGLPYSVKKSTTPLYIPGAGVNTNNTQKKQRRVGNNQNNNTQFHTNNSTSGGQQTPKSIPGAGAKVDPIHKPIETNNNANPAAKTEIVTNNGKWNIKYKDPQNQPHTGSTTTATTSTTQTQQKQQQQTPQPPKVETNPNANPSAHVEQPKATPQQNPSSIAGAGVQPHYPENFSAPKTPLVYKSQGKGAQNQNHTVAPPTPTNTTTTTPQPSAPKDTTQKTPTPPADNKTTTSGAPKVTAPEQPKAEPTSIPGAGASQKNNQTQSTETTGQTQQTAQTNNNQSTTGGNPSSISGAGATQNQNQNNQNPNQTQTNQGSTAFDRAKQERDARMAEYRKAKEEGKSASLGQTMEFWGDKASAAGEKLVSGGGDIAKGVVNAGKKAVTTGVSEGVRRTANIIGGKDRWDQFHEEYGKARNLAEKSEAVARGTARGLWGVGKRAVAGTAIAGAGALALGGLATYGAVSAAKGIARAGMNGASAVGGAIKQAMPNPAMHPPVNQPAPGTVPQSVVHHYH